MKLIRTYQKLFLYCFLSALTLAGMQKTFALDSVAEAYLDQGKRAFDRGDYRAAKRLFKEAADSAEKIYHDELYKAAIYNNLGESYRKLAESKSAPDPEDNVSSPSEYYQLAEKWLKMSLEIKEAQLGTYSLVLAQGLENLAAVYLDNDQSDESEALYRKALSIREHKGELGGAETASDYLRLGDVYAYSSRRAYRDAEQFYKKALGLYQSSSSGSDPVIGLCHQKLAFVHYNMHQLNLAINDYDRAVGIFSRNPKAKALLTQCRTELHAVAKDAYLKAFQEFYDKRKSFADGSPTTIACLHKIANAARRYGNRDDAVYAEGLIAQLTRSGTSRK